VVVRRGSHGEGGVQLAGSPSRTVDRYVLPVDAQVVLDEAGFLDAAMATAWWVPAGDRLQATTELCRQTGSFVLLAAEGTGKTFVLDSLREREPEAVRVNLATLDRSGTRGRLEEASAGSVPVYLYGLDSAVRQDSAVSGILQECLAEPHAAGTFWRLGCGPAIWHAGLAQAFRSFLMPFRELRLLPVTREAAAALAAEVIGDPKGFVDAVASARLGRALAASPRRLQAVARYWEENRGVLAASQLDAIRLEIDHLLQETGIRQPGSVVPQDRRRRLAARLAAMMVFGKAVRFTSDSQSLPGAPQGGILHSGWLPSSPEADQPGQKVAPAEYDEVLGTALFDAGAGSGVTFRHQQHAEFLAAEYVSTRPVTRGQLPVLLGMTADGAVPPSLAGVAAWIAVLAPGLAEGFPAANALALAKAAVEFPSPAFRAAVVDGILAEAASGNAYPLTGDLRPLVHPGLEAQLAEWLGRGVTRPEELWWVSMLAAAGGCRSLAGDLTRLLVGGNWRAWARRVGVRAVTALGDDRDLLLLKDLARLGADCDPVDSVLADVIGALYPRLMATAEALSLLRPQRNAGPVGPYSDFLGRLASQIPAADIPAALSWAAERVPDGPDAFGSLIPRLVRRGWELAASPDVREPLARLTVGLAGHLQWRWPEQDDLPWLGQPGTARRELALAVAARLTAGDAYNMLRLGLLGPPDLGWVLRELPNLEHPAQGTIARCVSSLAKNPDATVADLILGMGEAHPAYPYTADLREPLGTDCLPAQRARREWEREAANASRRKARRDERSAGLLSTLDGAARDPGRWWLVARWLAARDDEDSPQALFCHDLTTRPGWELLSEPQRQQVLDLGVRFLTLHQPAPSNRAGRAAVPADQADPDQQGVCLLTTLASHDHARLASLSATAWRAWAPAIVGARSRATTDDAEALCRLVDHAPSESKPAIVSAALAQLDAMQGPSGHPVPYQLYAHLCPLLAPGLAARLTDGIYHGDRGRTVLEMLVRHAPETAAAVCRQIAFTPGAALAADARRGLAELDPGSLVEDLRARRAGPGEVAELAPHVNVSVLTDPHLGVLGSMLLECVPFADDPPLRFGVFTPEPGYHVRRKRDIVLATLADRGQVGFFEELTGSVGPAGETIAWYFREARSRAADRSYPGLPSDQLLHLLSRADARLVRHDQDLLDVVIAQLDELQRELAGQHLYRFLWDSPGRRGGHPKSEDTVSDFVRRELQAGLREAFFEREPQVAGRGRGIGSRIDIESSVTTATHPAGKAHVIVEAKHVTNKDLMIDMHRQLARRYMLPKQARCGIYLVYWTDPDQRHAGPTGKRELLEQLKDQAAAAADEGLEIRPYLMDISWR
jgi:hypothetical protein